MEGRKAVDMISWLFLEYMGDSEDNFELNVALEYAKMDVEEDDAHSCCCHFMVFHDLGDAINDKFYHVDDGDEGNDYSDYDGEEEVSSREEARQHKKPRLSVDSIPTTMVLMNDEMEKSRLFWEACLAS